MPEAVHATCPLSTLTLRRDMEPIFSSTKITSDPPSVRAAWSTEESLPRVSGMRSSRRMRSTSAFSYGDETMIPKPHARFLFCAREILRPWGRLDGKRATMSPELGRRWTVASKTGEAVRRREARWVQSANATPSGLIEIRRVICMGHMGRPGLSAAQKAERWPRWKNGQSLSEIGRALGKHAGSIHGVVSSHGGFSPAVRRRSRVALTRAEREEISRGMAADCSIRQLAAMLGRSPSTVSRAIQRHGGPTQYRAAEADAQAWERARRPKPCWLATHLPAPADGGQHIDMSLVARANIWVAEAHISRSWQHACLP